MNRFLPNGPKGHFLPKMAKFGPKMAKTAKTRFFVKKTKTLFSSPYPYISSCKKSEKSNEAFPRKSVTEKRTDGRRWIYRLHPHKCGEPKSLFWTSLFSLHRFFLPDARVRCLSIGVSWEISSLASFVSMRPRIRGENRSLHLWWWLALFFSKDCARSCPSFNRSRSIWCGSG